MRAFLLKLFLVLFLVGIAVFALLNIPAFSKGESSPLFGVTFSPKYAGEFGVDWKKEYIAILDDLGVRYLRLSAYWDSTEPYDHEYDFSALDFQMDEAARRGAKVMFAVGRKLPRWPECHDPSWISEFTKKEIEAVLIEYVGVVVNRYKDHPALLRWQVENELLFPFGKCRNPFGMDTLAKEVSEVKAIDPLHEIVVTDSGEWTPWIPISFFGDMLGISMYRESWNQSLGIHIPFPVKEGWYQLRAKLISPWRPRMIVTELQAEPWGSKSVNEMIPEESTSLMPLKKIEDNIRFAKNVGLPEAYLWGVEWWYALREQGYPEIWNALKTVFDYGHLK